MRIMRDYIIVTNVPKRKVVKILESPPVTRGNVRSVAAVMSSRCEAIMEQYKYRLPEYDVLTTRAENLRAVQRDLPTLHGLTSELVETIVFPGIPGTP